MIKILNRWNSEVLHQIDDASTVAEAVTALVSKGANLGSANLYGANLYGANLGSANLYSANLYGADLRSANLYGANLGSANLYGADLRSANLYGANLRSANLGSANLRSADLRSANLYSANLSGANLYSADLRTAPTSTAPTSTAPTSAAPNLRSANLYGAKLDVGALAKFRICAEGSIVAWKKVNSDDGEKILRLEIPADARRLNAPGSRKCRAEYAIVCAIFNMEGEQIEYSGRLSSKHSDSYTYTIGSEARPNAFDADGFQECAPGIHFFITFEEARDY
jgi:hypothetical protein